VSKNDHPLRLIVARSCHLYRRFALLQDAYTDKAVVRWLVGFPCQPNDDPDHQSSSLPHPPWASIFHALDLLRAQMLRQWRRSPGAPRIMHARRNSVRTSLRVRKPPSPPFTTPSQAGRDPHAPGPRRLVEIRAAQRTFEGAYMRTALSQFSFALVVLKIFTSEFYPIGALFAVYGAAVMLVAIYRRYEGNRQFFTREELASSDDEEGDEDATRGDQSGDQQRREMVLKKKFRTSGNSVAFLAVVSLAAYIALLVLVWQLDS
jgi:hypothetical protein